ncbi:tetratricopeptide repeat protein, partial [Novosphingobium sp. 1949]
MRGLVAALAPVLAPVLAVLGAGVAVPVAASEVVQALPNPNTAKLSDALARLGRDQGDLEALLDAGDAARELGDFEAARRFFDRAAKVAPQDGRVSTGLARTALMAGDPVSAIAQFDAAQKAGADPLAMASDRGLAHDMVGDNAGAQVFYRAVLARGEDDGVRNRLAISQAIAGDLAASEQTLMPLLRKQDKPAWRTRAFTLAIAGDTKQAITLVETILPKALSGQVAPYLRYMPRLTSAQQAAAANLGRFPRASEIGRDDARIAGYTPPAPAAGAQAPAAAG